MRACAFALVVSVLAGCVHVHQTVAPVTVMAQASAIQQGTMLSAVTDDGERIEVSPVDPVQLVDAAGHRTSLRLMDAVAGCPERGCPLSGARDLVVRDDTHLSHGGHQALVLGGVAVVVGGALYCAAECSSGVTRGIEITAIVGGAVLVGGAVYAVLKYSSSAR